MGSTMSLLLVARGALAQGFIEWRVTSVFEALLSTLGVPLQPSAFGSAFDADRCTLSHDRLYRALQPGFDGVLSEEAPRVRKGVRAVGAALRSFGRSCERCELKRVAAELRAAAEEASTLTAHDVRWDDRALTVLVNDVNVSAPLHEAARAWFRERYEESGRSLGRAVAAIAGGDAADPLAAHDTWRGTTANGRVRTEREYVEHLSAEWARSQELLREAEAQASERPWQGPRFVPPFQRDEL